MPYQSGDASNVPSGWTAQANDPRGPDVVGPMPYMPVVEVTNLVAASGAALTIPAVSAATISNITLTANCTLTFPALTAGASFSLVLTQDATGSRLVTWPGGTTWEFATAPVLTTTAGAVDYLTFVCAKGTVWAGFVSATDVR